MARWPICGLLGLAGCTALPPREAIPVPPAAALAPGELPAPPAYAARKSEGAAALLPEQGPLPADGVLSLAEVLTGVGRAFPLLMAVEEERGIAGGQRLAAEGAFDLVLRTRGSNNEGTFGNSRFDASAEQALPRGGATAFGGYRLGLGDFPVYNGDQKTADGGEFRAGFLLPLLRDGPIDRRRATLRQAQIAENLADPTIRRAKLDYLVAAARAYWAWVAAGERHAVAQALFDLANDRQAGLEEQLKRGAETEYAVAQNKVLIAARQGELIAALRRIEQTALELSLYLRDAQGSAVVPPSTRLPRDFLRTPAPTLDMNLVSADEAEALVLRPELERFRLLKERLSVDLRLALNQTQPNISLGAAATQDVGKAKKSFTGTGIFATERTTAEVFLQGDLPLQRREALGRAREAQARLAQTLAQERFERERIGVQVRDAASNVVRTLERLAAARTEADVAAKVAGLERERFKAGAANLLTVNLQEVAAAAAVAKVVDALAEAHRAAAEYEAAVGREPTPTVSR